MNPTTDPTAPADDPVAEPPQTLGHDAPVSPCVANACRACCFDTQMPLLPPDIARLVNATGKAVASFSRTDPDTGQPILRNKDGHCVFLGPDGCTVYDHRPAGCRLYPLVHDPDAGRAVLDHDCPYTEGFRIETRDRIALSSVIASLHRLRGKR